MALLEHHTSRGRLSILHRLIFESRDLASLILMAKFTFWMSDPTRVPMAESSDVPSPNVFTPTQRPNRSISGPPLFPWLIAALI